MTAFWRQGFLLSKIFHRFSSNFLQSLNKCAGNANNSRFGLPRNQKGLGKTTICMADSGRSQITTDRCKFKNRCRDPNSMPLMYSQRKKTAQSARRFGRFGLMILFGVETMGKRAEAISHDRQLKQAVTLQSGVPSFLLRSVLRRGNQGLFDGSGRFASEAADVGVRNPR